MQTAHVSKLSGIVFAREVAIHRGSKDAGGFVCSVSGSQWIATGLRPRDDNTLIVIARRERSEERGNPSCLGERGRLVSSFAGSQWIATGFQPSR